MLESVLERGLDTSNGLDFVRERLALVARPVCGEQIVSTPDAGNS